MSGCSPQASSLSQLTSLLRAKTRMALNHIASVRTESKLKVSVVSVAAVLLWIGAFLVFHRGFTWLRSFGLDPTGDSISLGDIVMTQLLSVMSLALFLMLIFSNTLISFSTLYRSHEVPLLIQSPLPVRFFFLGRFFECVVFSSWASAYLGSPLILAYGLTTDAPWPFYVAAVVYYVPYVTIPAAIGAGIAMAVVRVFPRLPRGSMILFAAVSVAALFFYARGRFDTVAMPGETIVDTVMDGMRQTQSPFLPSYWAARGVLDAADTRYSGCLYHFMLLTANALMVTFVCAQLAEWTFYTGYSLLSSHASSRQRRNNKGILGRLEGTFRFLRQPERSLVIKDIRLFWRDPTQWSQFVIFFGIMAIYIANLRDRTVDTQNEMFRSWIVCMNIAACTLILATLTSRFVFPLVSLEGRRLWILGLAPITFRQIMRQKFWLSVATTSVFTITVVVLSCIRLRVEPVPFALAVYSIIITNFGLSGLAVGLGSLYPNFHEDNPARIVSGMGGTLNFLMSMGYLVLIVGAETLILQWRVLERYTSPNAFWWALAAAVAFITVLSACATLVPMRLGLHNLESSEY